MPETAPLPLDPRAIRLNASADGRDDAIRQCGEALLAVGAVEEAYIDTMIERERSISTYVGEGVAIPHGTLAAKEAVRHDAISVVRFPDGVDWDGDRVTVCIGIAARGNGHVALLAQLAEILMEPDQAQALREATEVAEVVRLLQSNINEEDESQ
ncbi:PTS sugar transporter subunit IIA [Streptosporangium sp. 'caverna']|uniref:PTS sugar transporter subunit IIA n=1 Tax=Streptosporangium sp. 'caverna' TaxID=2202249 RepID=UPI000D7D4E56|nr:PTS sugar transporter subunit IIA [Streptosporangium sp. 'caverna']AWS42705.1 PTS sugar transporter subunit IIA [Streptosporangium sp. 'caverna']